MIVFGTTALFHRSLLRTRRTFVFLFSASLFLLFNWCLEGGPLICHLHIGGGPSLSAASHALPKCRGQHGGRSACNWKWPLVGSLCQALSLSANWHDEYPEYTAASIDWWRPASGELIPDSGAPQPICCLSLTGGLGIYVWIHPWSFCVFLKNIDQNKSNVFWCEWMHLTCVNAKSLPNTASIMYRGNWSIFAACVRVGEGVVHARLNVQLLIISLILFPPRWE